MAPYETVKLVVQGIDGGDMEVDVPQPLPSPNSLSTGENNGQQHHQIMSTPSPLPFPSQPRKQQNNTLSTTSPVPVSVSSDSPSVYDLFHVHHDEEEDEQDDNNNYHYNTTSSLLLFPQQSTSLQTESSSFPAKASNNNIHSGIRLPPRPTSFIRLRQQGSQAKVSNDGTRTNSTSPLERPTSSYNASNPYSRTSPLSPQLGSQRTTFNHHNHYMQDNESTPLFSKMQDLMRREDPEYISLTSNHSSANTLCGFCCSWLVWVHIWILLFAAVIQRQQQQHPAQVDTSVAAAAARDAALSATTPVATTDATELTSWTRWERIYFSASTFWTVGYGDLVITSHRDRLLTCAFLIISLCFFGLALGRWGNSVIEAYKAASLTHATAKRQRQQQQQQQRLNQVRNDCDNDDPMMAFLWNTHGRTSSTSRTSSRSSTLEVEEFVVFPGLSWLLVQSLFMTALSIFCVFAIQYYEQDVEVSDEWTAVSTLYFAVSTATTVGFGDLVPVTRQGKILCVFFLPVAVGTSLHWLVWMAQRGIQRIQRNMIHRRDLSNLRLDEFYERRLQIMGLVDASTFAALKKEYEQMS
ncbi:ion channel [Nitzschia inconspicua]|uniref:Ion channel n=1 Tax=Nitzschia inconspicua TaxID=303405 RepID=A0A9K3Q5R5_9STRA|nr:ion channel [Nitzschia inconspicua]